MEKNESPEEKAFIISHNALPKAKASFDWNVLSRADHVQQFSSDCDCNLFAFYSAPGIIDLWDLSTSPVALAFLNVPSRSAHVDQYEENECRCINWSRCKKLQSNVVSASFISELPNMVLLSSKMMITDSQVLLDCCSREMKRVKGWGEQNSSNIITEDLPKAAYASQPLHLETAPSLSPDRGPGCLSSDANVDRLCVPVFCVSALLQHLPSDLGSVAAGEVTQSAFISTLAYAYVAESISRSVDATSSHLGGSGSGESGEEVIKKVQISTRPIGEDDAELLTRCLIHNYTESIIEESKRDVQRRMHSEQSLQEKERSSQLPSSDHDHDCATSTSTLPTPAVTETFKAFVSRSGTCSLRCILSVCVYSSSSSSNIRLQSLKTSRVAYCSETNREAYEILLATGCGHDPVSGEVSGTLCDVRMLDSSLKVLAVLGMDDPCALTAVTSSTYQCHELSVPLSLPLPPSLPAEGQGKGVESVKASESKATSLDMPWRSAAIYLITSACLVPAVCVPQSSYSNKLGEIAVALVTAYSKERPLLSNKLLFWQPLIRSDGVSKISSLKESEKEKEEESGFSHTQECISTAAMAANCSDLPFINMPAISGTWNGTGARKEVTGLGSRGPHMLASTSGTGQHQYLVLGDINGHVWGTTIGPHTDFPGPMYPPGFTLMQRVESYIEREDELDNVNVLPSNSLAERPSCDPIGYECLHSYDASDSHPFIDVGVSPYFLNDPTGVFLTPPSNIICTGHTVVSRFRQRLPLRLLGSARDVMLERKARALFLRKASMARVRVPSAASRKRTVTARGGNTKLNNNKKKKKKLSFASMAETQEHNSTDDKCTASGTCSFLTLLAPSLTDGASEHGEPGLSTAASSPLPLPSPSLLQGCAGIKADEADTDRLDVDVDVVDEAAGTHSLIKVSGGSSRNGDRDGDRPQHDDSDDSESDNESMSVPLSKPSSHPDDAEAEKRPALDPFLSVALSDVLPVPRRVLTGDFAVRLLKAKEVGLAITMKRLSGTVLAERLLQIEREAVENTKKAVMKKEKGRLRVIKNRVEKAAAKRLVEENAAAATAASAITYLPTLTQIPAAEGSTEEMKEEEKEKALEVTVTVKDADPCHEVAGESGCLSG